jgi:hypothetical protein
VTALDGRFVRQIASATTNPGGTGGGVADHAYPAHGHTYTHNHAGSWGDSGFGGATTPIQSGAGETWAAGHNHAVTSDPAPIINATNNISPAGWSAHVDPAHVTVIFIQSDGSPTGWPVSMILWKNGAAPAGWAVYTNLDNRLMRGANTGADGGAQSGNDSHTHTAPHTHPIGGSHAHQLTLGTVVGTTTGFQGAGGGNGAHDSSHTHAGPASQSVSNPANSDSGTETSGTGDQAPPWKKMRAIQKITSPAYTVGVIAMWLGTLAAIPGGMRLADGRTGQPNLSDGKFVRGAATDGEVGNLGGTTAHAHATGAAHGHGTTPTHQHSQTVIAGTNTGSNQRTPFTTSGTGVAYYLHDHPSAATASSAISLGTSSTIANSVASNTTNNPAYTEVAYIEVFDQAPNTPSAINSPVAATVYDASITLSATATDPEGDNWRSAWEYSPDNGTNWYAVPGFASIVASGAASTLLWDTTLLAQGTLYKVRAWAVDVPSGLTSPKLTLTGNFTLDHNVAPNAPSLTAPSAGTTLDLAAMPAFTWAFSDPNVGDTQSAYALKLRRVSDSLTRWWDGAAWQTAETFVTTAAQTSSPNNTIFTKGEQWAWSMATKDNGGPSGVKTGPYSSERTFTASTKVNPVITDPTAGAPANIPTADYTMVWTAAEQSKFRARLLGGGGFSVVVEDTGIVTDAATRQWSLGPMANGATYRFEITTYNNEGLASNVVTIDKAVVYTTGAVATLVLTART